MNSSRELGHAWRNVLLEKAMCVVICRVVLQLHKGRCWVFALRYQSFLLRPVFQSEFRAEKPRDMEHNVLECSKVSWCNQGFGMCMIICAYAILIIDKRTSIFSYFTSAF